MRTKRPNVPNPVARGFPPSYDPAFKKVVILYAEKKSNQEARKRYGITEETIRRWRRAKDEIMEQSELPVRRSQRLGHDSCSESTSSKCDSDIHLLREGLQDSLSLDLDSMPLKQRLSQNLNESSMASMSSESPLQSLPLSPTKLKVTRQGGKTHNNKSSESSEVCLKWNSYHSNMQTVFPNLLTKEQYVDATLVSEGQMLKCHKMILSSCSPYFEEILSSISPFQHPVLFMKDVPFWALKAMCDFMYAGEVHISQDKIQDLLAAAATFKIKGLGTPVDKSEPKQTEMPQIKREANEVLSNKVVKTEKTEENISGLRLGRSEVPKERVSRRKEERKTFQDVFEELNKPQTSKTASRKEALASKPSLKGLGTFQSKPSTSRLNYAQRKANSIRRSGRAPKIEAVSQESNKVKDVPVLTKTNINDPLDLLQPVYEEVTKDVPNQLGRSTLGKLRGSTKRMRKRKLVDYVEDREEVQTFWKGTRSRPNVKIPKVFDSHYEETLKEATVATIVREPHTDQNDPLIGVDVEEIKAEPVDVDESAIEVEENMVNYIVQDHGLSSQEDEEIIGNFDSPLVNIRSRTTPNMFKKHQPFIVDVHTVSESDVRMLDIQNENVEIVDIAKISNVVSQAEDGAIINNFESGQRETSQIVITNVQSMADSPSESASDKECSNETTAVDQGNNIEKNGDDPLMTLQCDDPLVSEVDCTDRKEAESCGAEENVIENDVLMKEDKTELLPETKEPSQDILPVETLEEKKLPDDIQKLEELPGQTREIDDKPQEEIDEIPKLEEIPLEPMEMGDNAQELNDDIPKLEELPLESLEMDDTNQALIRDTQKLTEIKENGLEDSSDIQLPLETENLSTPSSEDSQPLLTPVNVEAELEECLASTSTLINPSVPEKLDFFDNEDFTKDVELEDLSCSKPLANWSSFKDESEFLGDRDVVPDTRTVDFCEVEQFSAEEDQNRLEDSLLADLEDEMSLKESSGRTNDDPEKTLEMIVQDLNDSLYEMEK